MHHVILSCVFTCPPPIILGARGCHRSFSGGPAFHPLAPGARWEQKKKYIYIYIYILFFHRVPPHMVLGTCGGHGSFGGGPAIHPLAPGARWDGVRILDRLDERGLCL